VFMKLRRLLGATDAREPREMREPSHRAVSVRSSEDACQAIRQVQKGRVLSTDAPLLPLDGCDRPGRCTCYYQHFDDRRDGPRRQAEGAPPVRAAAADSERRCSSGRRAEERLDYDSDEADRADEAEDSTIVADTDYGYARKPDRT